MKSKFLLLLFALSIVLAGCNGPIGAPTPSDVSGGGGGASHPPQGSQPPVTAQSSPVPAAPATNTAEPPQLGRTDLKDASLLDKVYVFSASDRPIPIFKKNTDGSIVQSNFIRNCTPVLVSKTLSDGRLGVILPWVADPKDDPSITILTEGVVLSSDVKYLVKPIKGVRVYPKEGGAGLFRSTTTFNDSTTLKKVMPAGEPVVLLSDIKDAGLEVEANAYMFFGYTYGCKESVKLITLSTPLPTKLPLSVRSSTLTNLQSKPNLLLVLIGASEKDQFDVKINGEAVGRYIAQKQNNSVVLEFPFTQCGPEQDYSVIIQHALTNEHYESYIKLKVPCQ